MAYIDDHKIPGESSITWNGKTYWPVTTWTVSSGTGGGESWQKAAVRFLMSDDSSELANHIIAQYGTWSTTGTVVNNYHTRNSLLIQRLNSKPTTGVNEAGVDYTGANAVGRFFSTLNTNQRTGYPASATITGNIIWYNQPYIVTDCGTVGPGITVSSKTFYTTMSDVPSSAVSISGTYTTPLETYIISYDANDPSATGTTADTVKVKGTDASIASCGYTLTGYHFKEWNTAADGTGTTYMPGDTYSTDADLALYTIWEPDHIAPYFTNTPTVTRCDAGGNQAHSLLWGLRDVGCSLRT
ncbi:MAG: InlB B-repeat-containing protein [Atopobiaceae bacterium]|nr:InlB B-repeat-containing protein [Atopobiaceae bacterium]